MKTDLGFVIKGPPVTEDEIDALCALLDGKGWLTAEAISAFTALDDRKLRAIRAASGGRIISGKNGYRIFDASVTLAEVEESTARKQAMAREILRSVQDEWRMYHRFHGKARKESAA